MRISLILGVLMGLLTGIWLSSQVATSQEDTLPNPERAGAGRYQIAGHSTYPPLLLDSETGTSWILMSTSDGEQQRWIWEPIAMQARLHNPSQSKGRDIAVLEYPRHSERQPALSQPSPVSW